MMIVVHLCKYTKSNCIVYLKQMNFMYVHHISIKQLKVTVLGIKTPIRA